ncbi:MAG: hypothetical protein MO852_11690 [Candidatus Devosia euplotis]|nr:hypothetical protein [Candidatus Devosia euplotis]
MSLTELRTFCRTQIAIVFQKFGLLPHRSVIDNVAYSLEVRGVAKAERLATAAKWIEAVVCPAMSRASRASSRVASSSASASPVPWSWIPTSS